MGRTAELLTVSRDNGTFRLVGELDMSNTATLSEALQGDLVEGGRVVLDCEGLTFIDSTGIAALVQVSRALGPSGRLVLRSPTTSLVKAFGVLGLNRIENLELET